MEKLYAGKGSLHGKWAALATILAGAATAPVNAQDISWVPIQQVEPGGQGESVIAERPRIASDGGGNVIAVYGAKPNGLVTPAPEQLGVQVLRSSTNGTSWTVPAQQLSQAATGKRPDIATDGVGNWIVTWQQDPPAGISTARSTNNGASWTGTGSASAAFGSQLSNNTNVVIATNNGGTWMAAWVADDTVNSTSTVAIARSADNGNTWQPVGTLGAPVSGAAPAIAGHASNGFLVTYEKESAGGQSDLSDVAFAAVSPNGTITSSGLVNSDHATDSEKEFAPSVTASAAGNWAITWARQSTVNSADWQVAGAVASAGLAWSAPTPISFPPGTNFSSGALADPSSAYGEAGRLVTLWTSTQNSPEVPRDILYNFQRTSELETNQTRLDLDFGLLNTPYFNRPHVTQLAGGRWLGMWQRLEIIPDGENLSASSPWFSHGLESGIAPRDTETNTDLSITKTAWPDPAVNNGELGYVITVRNLGATDSANLVNVIDQLPPGVTFSHAVASQGTWSQGVVDGQPTVVAHLGSIAPGKRATVAIAVRPTVASGTINNTASVSFLGTDPDPSNNSATVSTGIGSGGTGNPPGTGNPDDPANPVNPDVPNDSVEADVLQITVLDVQTRGKEPKPGKAPKPYKTKLKALVANATTLATPATAVEVYLSDDAALDGSDALVSGKALKSVKPGKALKLKLSISSPGNPAGKHLLLVIPGQTPVPVAL